MALIEREFVVVALTHLAKHVDVVVIAGDQRAELAARHAQVLRQGINVLLGGTQVGFGAGKILAQRADLFLIRLLGDFLLQLFGLLRSLLLELRHQSLGVVELPSRRAHALRRLVQFGAERFELLGIGSLDLGYLARHLIAQVLTGLGQLRLLSSERAVQRANFAQADDFAHDQKRENAEDGDECGGVTMILSDHSCM